MVRGRIRLPVRALSSRAIANLDKLCLASSAQIVVSSMWRIDRDVPSILTVAGFKGQFHPDWRTDTDGPQRSDEIERWLDAHGGPSYIVIDDKQDDLASMRTRLVLTDNYTGLTAADVESGLLVMGGCTALGFSQGISIAGHCAPRFLPSD